MLLIRYDKWYYRIRLKGREYVKATGLEATPRNKTAAMQQEAEARKRLKGGLPLEDAVDGRFFKDAAREYLDWKDGEHREHPNTAKRVRVSFVSLSEFFGSRLVHEIHAGDIERFKTWRRGKGMKEVTVRHDLHSLSDFLQYARRQKWILLNPLDDVEIPSDQDAVREHVVSETEEAIYFKAARERSEDLHDLARLVLDQGFRPEEVEQLSVFDYDRAAGKIRVKKSKSKASERTLLLTPAATHIIERRMRQARELGTSWLFPSPKDALRPMGKVNKPHDAVCDATGLSFTIYEFRHTFATRLGDAGVSAPVLMKLLGHSSLRCVMRYCHIGQDAADDAMRLMTRIPPRKRAAK